MIYHTIRKLTVLAAVIISSVLMASASPVSPQRALSRAISGKGLRTGTATDYRLAHTEMTASTPAVYIFSRGDNGFIVVPADDSFPAVLGYCDSGTFDYATAPPQFKRWIESYAAASEYYLANPDKIVKSLNPAPRKEVLPLVASQWNQDYPYNLDCPLLKGHSTYSGCVATAMAQVVNYHKYPQKGRSLFTYTWNDQTLSYAFGRKTFDFANMLDSYLDQYSDEQADAVANLIYACAVAVAMDFGITESGAPDCRVASSLRSYFCYDGTTRYMMRNYFSRYEWEAMVYEELAAGRPMVYGGYTAYGGHEFVCDGYRDGYFHINWGWGGSCDGYYLLDALEPGSQGIGGYEGGYNLNQSMICGIRPDQGSPIDWYPLYATGDFNISVPTGASNLSIRFPDTTGLYNYSNDELRVNCYLKVVPEDPDDKSIYYSPEPTRLIFMPVMGLELNGYQRLDVKFPRNIPEGRYKAYIGFITPENRWLNLNVPFPSAPYVYAYVDAEGNVTYSKGDLLTATDPDDISLLVTDISGSNDVALGENAPYQITISNESPEDYNGRIYFALTAANTDGMAEKDLWRKDVIVNVPAGREIIETVYFDFRLPVGEYILSCYDISGNRIGNDFPLKITEQGKVTAITAGEDDLAEVYTIDGRMLRSGADSAYIASLPRGIYLIRTSRGTKKLCK